MKKHFFGFLFLLIYASQIFASINLRLCKYENQYIIGWNGYNKGLLLIDTHPMIDTKSSKIIAISKSVFYKGFRHNFVVLDSLENDKTYYFQIISENFKKKTQVFHFQTFSEDVKELKLITGGDSRNSVPIFEVHPKVGRKALQKGNRLVAKLSPDAILFNGDFILNRYPLMSKREWKKWLNDWQLTISSDGKVIPIIPALGNHESDKDLQNIFGIPQQHGNYITDFGHLARVITLDNRQNVCNTPQTFWLDSIMQVTPSSVWKIAQYHIPASPVGTHYGKREDVLKCWWTIFEKHQLDFANEAHAHLMKTSYPLVLTEDQQSFQKSENSGTIILGEGAWGAPLRKFKPDTVNYFDIDAYHGFHYLIINQDSSIVYSIDFSQTQDSSCVIPNANGVISRKSKTKGDCFVVKKK